MNSISFNPISFLSAYAPLKQNHQYHAYSTTLQGPDRDIFERTTVTSPAFTAKNTRAGMCLKVLDNITDPYSGIKMLPGSKIKALERMFLNQKTINGQMKVLSRYTKYMQPLEKEMYETFEKYGRENPNGTLNKCLQEMRPTCVEELKKEQLNILDNVDKMSGLTDETTAAKIKTVTSDAREKIIDDNPAQTFKRKELLANLRNATKECGNQNFIENLHSTACKLPTSSKNINAFVVKYANRPQGEIATRLLEPSVCSIEHIHPASTLGDNNLANFMLVSRSRNSDRGSIPLEKYIKKHPSIPENSQKYANDIISAIKNGKLEECDWYPYVLKERLYNESNGIIDIDISNYKKSEEDAFKNAPEKIINTYNDLKKANSLSSRNT